MIFLNWWFPQSSDQPLHEYCSVSSKFSADCTNFCHETHSHLFWADYWKTNLGLGLWRPAREFLIKLHLYTPPSLCLLSTCKCNSLDNAHWWKNPETQKNNLNIKFTEIEMHQEVKTWQSFSLFSDYQIVAQNKVFCHVFGGYV